MRKTILAAAIGLAAFAGVLVSANTLGGVRAADVGSGADLVATCDTDGVDVGYTTTWSGGDYLVDQVTVSAINEACVGGTLDLTLADGDGTTTASASGQQVVGTSATVTVVGTMPVDELAEVAVVIHGGGAA